MSDELTETQVEESEPEAPAPDPLRSSRPSGTEYLDLAQRVQADFENYRKRAAREQERLVAHAHERLVRELLPILDDLERALEAAERHEEAQLVDGVKLVEQSLRSALARKGWPRSRPTARSIPTSKRCSRSRATTRTRARCSRSCSAATASVIASSAREGDRRGMNRNPYEVLGVAEERVRRRHQEGVPQARTRVPPGPQPGDNGAEERFKEVQAPTTSSPTREAEGVRHLRRAVRAGSLAARRRHG